MRRLMPCFLLLPMVACEGAIDGTPAADAAVLVDAGAPPPGADASVTPGPDAAAPGADAAPDAPPAPGGLADDLRVARVDLFQSVRVPIAEDGAPADRDDLPVVAGRDALVRVHAEALSGWREREVSAVLELEIGGVTRRFVDTKIPSLPADDADPESLFGIAVPADAIAPGARFRVRLEVSEGGADVAPDAIYPAGGGFAELDAEILGAFTLVLVPFRYDTDGSNRLPDTGDAQLARYRAELTSRFPYAEIDLRVHDVVPWTRSDRIGGNVDWGAVNARLISMRDDEGAAEDEYWYGLMAPDTSRSAHCGSVVGSCVTGQSYVATLGGSRVGSGVGFGDTASVGTLAHELGHMHGRYHSPCGTSGTDDDYPYAGGVIGTWGWDRRTGAFHAPDEATDLLGYCRMQWISDYNYRAIYERHLALRARRSLHPGLEAPPRVARRFVTMGEGEEVRWGDTYALRSLPGERTTGVYLDAAGRTLAVVAIGALEGAHGDERTWVVPAAPPPGATTLHVDGSALALP